MLPLLVVKFPNCIKIFPGNIVQPGLFCDPLRGADRLPFTVKFPFTVADPVIEAAAVFSAAEVRLPLMLAVDAAIASLDIVPMSELMSVLCVQKMQI